MALRRVLPSRSAPEKSPESAAVAASKAPPAPPKSPEPVTEAPASVAQSPVATAWEGAAFAEASMSAFGTLPTAEKAPETSAPVEEGLQAAPARVLEDTFIKAPDLQAEQAAGEPEAPVVAGPAAPEPAFTAPAWDAPATEVTYVAAAWDAPADTAAPAAQEPAPVSEASAPTIEVAPAQRVDVAPEPVVEPAAPSEPEAPVVAAAPMAVPFEPEQAAVSTPEVAAPAFVSPVQEVAPQPDVAIPAGPTTFDFQPSRPDNSPIKRRVREKRPRDFSAMGSEPEAPVAQTTKPVTRFAPSVPVDTKPLDQVDESLIATGVLAPRPQDSLTGNLPTGLAEMEVPLAPEPEPYVAPEPAPAYIAPVIEAPAIEATPAPQPAPMVIADPAPANAPSFDVAPRNIPIPVPADPVEDELQAEPLPLPRVEVPVDLAQAAPADIPAPRPSNFNLSSTAPQPPVELPAAASSDLPWTQPQAAAEWDIGAPAGGNWADLPGDNAAPASHMPPPASDLYKPIGAPTPPQIPGLPTRSTSTFTPELPGQRAKQGGTPWLFMVLGVVVVAGAGMYFLRPGGTSLGSQQLTNLTTPSGNNQQTDGILAPPQVEGGTSSFFAAVPPAPVADSSSSAIVNFADVPPEQAAQPIVATGNEEMPAEMSLLAQLQNEVEKARERKEGGQPAVSASSTAPVAGGENADEMRARFQEEMAAYRSALAQSGNPSELKPSTFRSNPDRMTGTDASVAAGSQSALLAPPAVGTGPTPPSELYTNNPNNLPVVSEPIANAPARVRTLADFPDIEPYMPEREKVAIPKNLKPKMAATDFPALEVLSFVPGKGIVAFADGREGVLLIGESLNGWELVAVTPDNAEFKAGQKNHQVTSQN